MRQQNIKAPIAFRLGLILLCLLLVTVYMMSGIYARYSSTATASSRAKVAKFEFSDNLNTQVEPLSTNATELYPGWNKRINIEIQNKGEVTLTCKVTIENLTNNLPIENTSSQSVTVASGKTETVSVTLQWPEDKNSVEYEGKTDVLRISVSVEQAD